MMKTQFRILAGKQEGKKCYLFKNFSFVTISVVIRIQDDPQIEDYQKKHERDFYETNHIPKS